MIEPSRLGFYSDIGYKAIETQHMLRLYNWVVCYLNNIGANFVR